MNEWTAVAEGMPDAGEEVQIVIVFPNFPNEDSERFQVVGWLREERPENWRPEGWREWYVLLIGESVNDMDAVVTHWKPLGPLPGEKVGQK